MRKRESGFSLVEVMVAMTMFAVGLLGVAAVMPALKIDMTHSDQRTRATFIAQETAEWLHGLAYDDAALDVGLHQDPNYPEPHVNRSWEVVEGDPLPGVKRITVRVVRQGQAPESATLVVLHAQAGH